ncbi:trigger factor [Thermogemmatispora sp.]|uniref:trigger factor n=1 Tax=Thermogemmatispora sp. TaxID=1968838 RepID=UPI001DFFBFF6|nr:trigger factor [Thermogemmatispora sp.]MBX5449556.1 trigger factor [Thermogemmatispora sp.]
MKVTVEKLPTSEAVLEVDLTWEEVEKASDKAYRKLVQQVDIQGFRRGKAPRSLLERKLGKEYIYQEGLDDLISEAYREAIKEHQLTPLAQPELDAPMFEMGQPYHFRLKVPILTPVELGDYRSLHFEDEEVMVTAEEVERELESLRNQHASWQQVDRPAQVGDRVTVDLKLTVEGRTISDYKDNPFELTTGRPGLFAGMDEQIIGMQVGESKSFTLTIPSDYGNEELAGKEAHYEVTLRRVEEKVLPELDDAFAARVGQYETLEDLRKVISDAIQDRKERQKRQELREKVLEAVVAQSRFVLHPILIKEEVEDMLHELSHMLERQRMSLDQYLLLMRKSREEYMKELEPDAERRVKQQLVLDEVARREGIEVTPEEVEGVFRMYAQAGQPLQRSEAQIRALVISLRREKALSRLVELATRPAEEGEQQAAVGEEQTSQGQQVKTAKSETAVAETEAAPTPAAEQTSEATSSAPATIVVDEERAPVDSNGQQ